MQNVELTGSDLNLEDVIEVVNGAKVSIAKKAYAQINESRQYVEKRMQSEDAIYGVNTGFGAFSKVRISRADLEKLQVNLVRSHACGVGDPLSIAESRAILLLRANTLVRGHSGVRPQVIETILEFLNQNVIPVIPSQGSVGASGDLAPMAHLSLALIGEGEIWDNGVVTPSGEVLKRKGIQPLQLMAKEGLSLINGCQVMTAIGLLALAKAREAGLAADLAGALALEALRGSRSPFYPMISANRPHPGEAETARNILKLIGPSSPIADSHLDCDRVQDAYSVRCMPAVHGSFKAGWRRCLETLLIEANSSTDNPLVFANEDEIISCGNFHGQPVATALDQFALAVTSLMSISEKRIEKLINPAMSDLPAFLTPKGGLNSGYMMAHVTAAALVSESKILCHPASIDAIPTSADKEDHVSMGTIAARKLSRIVDHLESVVAIELMAAKQGLHLLKPLRVQKQLSEVEDYLHDLVPPLDDDRYLAPEIRRMQIAISSSELNQKVRLLLKSDLEI